MTQASSADIGVTGLAVMGRNLARNLARHGHVVALHNRSPERTRSLVAEHGERGHVRAGRVDEGVRGQPEPAAGDHHHGQGRPADRRGHRRTGPAAGRGRHRHRLRQRALHGHPAPGGRAARARPALRRLRRVRRRGRRAARPEHHARRVDRSPTPSSGPIFESIAAQVDGTPCCTHVGPGRGRPLRQDGAQRHRVRRHAAHRRGLRPAPGRPGRAGPADRRDLPHLERGRPGLVPDPDHRRGARAHRRGDRPAVRGHRARPGRAEGHRPVDGAERAGPRHPDHRHRRGHVRPVAVRARGPARGGPGQRSAPRPRRWTSPTRTRSSRTSGARCTRPRWSRTRRASTRSPRAARSTTGTSTAA